jgi:hypothetical protein
MIGRTSIARVNPPTRAEDLGKLLIAMNIVMPNKPNTIEGTAARLLILTSINFVIKLLGANSSK